MSEKREALAKEILIECEKENEPVTFEEALEMADMELSAKEGNRHYETSNKKRKPKKVVKKVDESKAMLLEDIKTVLAARGAEIRYQLNEVEVDFEFDNQIYTVKLTRHGKDWTRKQK